MTQRCLQDIAYRAMRR